MIWILRATYFLCPILAIGSVIWFFVSDVGIWALMLFFFFGFLGMFAGGATKQIEDQKRKTFTFHPDDPLSISRAAFYEIEAKDDVPGFSLIKEDVLSMLNDREKTTASIVDDKLDPKGLIYLLISNVAYANICSGQYHIYRGTLSANGKQLMAGFKVASRQMVAHGIHDQAAHEQEMASLKKEIAAIG